jgi:GDPmannose 4,6-dehydratase
MAADGPGGVALVTAGVPDFQAHIESDSALLRPADEAVMVGDASKPAAILDWRPTKSFGDIINAMVVFDLREEQTR